MNKEKPHDKTIDHLQVILSMVANIHGEGGPITNEECATIEQRIGELAETFNNIQNTAIEVDKQHEAEIARIQNAWQMERDIGTAWQTRVKRLRRGLSILAEAPQICDECEQKLLAPVAYDKTLPDDIPF